MKYFLFLIISFSLLGTMKAQEVQTFYENGKLKFKGDTLNGSFTTWYPSGELMTTGFFKNRQRDSVWTSLNKEGFLISKLI